MSDLKLRIKKLLAMAQSTSENEARTALLKARELMAQNKLTYSDLDEVRSSKVITVTTDHVATKMKDFWKCALADAIAEKYCCKAVMIRKHGTKSYTVQFIGFEEDLEICQTVYEYALGYVQGQIRLMSRGLRDYGFSTEEIRKTCNGFGEGFSAGVYAAFKEQDKANQQYGLVLVTPQEVQKAVGATTKISASAGRNMSYDKWNDGYTRGKNFRPNAVESATNVDYAKIA